MSITSEEFVKGTDIAHPTKICTVCNIKYPATREYFNIRKRSKDGLAYKCRLCVAGDYNRIITKKKHIYDEKDVKTCSACSKEYPANKEYFFKQSSMPDGLNSRCKSCAFIYNRQYTLKSKYNITIEEYNSMFKKQEGRCSICNKKQDNKPLVIDHNHENGNVRELLCNNCNVAIGLMSDSAIILQKATDYLNKHREV